MRKAMAVTVLLVGIAAMTGLLVRHLEAPSEPAPEATWDAGVGPVELPTRAIAQTAPGADASDDAGCDFAGTVTVTGAATTPVVVFLERVSGSSSVRVAPKASLTISLHGHAFDPPLAVVTAGDTVTFRNDDADFHAVFSRSETDVFELPQSRNSVTSSRVFAWPGLTHLQCNNHGKERADLVVSPTPWFTLVGASGAWRLHAPAGRWRVTAIEPNGGRTEVVVPTCTQAVSLVVTPSPTPILRRKDGSAYQ